MMLCLMFLAFCMSEILNYITPPPPLFLKMLHKRFEFFNDIINLFLFCADADQIAHPGESSKPRARSQQSPAKSSSRSPLRNATQDSNVRKTSSVDFKEPLVADRYFSYSQALSKTPLATLSELLRASRKMNNT